MLSAYRFQEPQSIRRATRLSIVLMIVLAVISGALLAFPAGTLNATIKLAAGITIAAAVATAMLYRPVLVPLSIYLVMVPFEALLKTSDGTLTKFLALAATGLILLVLTDRRRTVTPPAAVWWWGAFAILNLFSLMWSEQPMFRTGLFVMMAQLFAIYAIFSMLRVTVLEVRIFLGCALAGGVGLAVMGVWMFTHGVNVHADTASSRLNISSGIDADHYGATLILPMAIALAGLLHNRQWWTRVTLGGFFIVLLAGVFVSGTRGSLISVAGMLLYVGIFYGYRLAIGSVALGGIVASLAFPSIYQRFTDASQGEAGARYSIWRIAWDAFQHHWLLGIGTGQFQLAYAESYIRAASGTLVHRWAEDAHNVLVSTGVELGIVGVIVLIIAWTYQVRVGKNIARSSPLFAARIACEAAAVGLFIDGMSLDIMFRKYFWVAFMLGVLVRNAGLTERAVAAEQTAVPAPSLAA